jgi:hypothetical protein
MKFPMAIEDVVTDTAEVFRLDLRGRAPESWRCIDCDVDTAPGCLARADLERAYKRAYVEAGMAGSVDQIIDDQTEVYTVRDSVWKRAGMEPWNGCLCVGCLEKRLGRRLKPKDFNWNDPINQLPGSARLTKRRGRR